MNPEQEPQIEKKEKHHTLSVEYLTGLWDLPREQVLEKILKERIPYIDDVPVGGK